MQKIGFSAVLIACCVFFPFSLNALEWNLVNEEFNNDGDFGAFTTVEHTGADRTAEVSGGAAVLKRVAAGGDIGPTIRAYFDDPNVNEFILQAKIDAKNISEDGHFDIAMRINGFEYFPAVALNNIGDHESPEQYNTGIRTKEAKVSPLGMHEYLLVGKSAKAYDLYFDGNLIIEDGVTRALSGQTWEIAQAMIHVRKGTNAEIHVDSVRVKQGTDGLDELLNASAVSSRSKLVSTWGKMKER